SVIVRVEAQMAAPTAGDFELSKDELAALQRWSMVQRGLYAIPAAVHDLTPDSVNPTAGEYVRLNPDDWL
ncbi:MAG: hypothetical protein AAGC55_34105, partial [Myxococcota bacterium]